MDGAQFKLWKWHPISPVPADQPPEVGVLSSWSIPIRVALDVGLLPTDLSQLPETQSFVAAQQAAYLADLDAALQQVATSLSTSSTA